MYRMVHSVVRTSQARERLLAAAVRHALEDGIADLSLRGIAAAIGTSHRMLIYHFGSKEGLLIAVSEAVEAEQRERLAAFDIDPSMTPAETTRAMWKHLSNPKLWPNERLFFEMYGQALQSRAHTAGFLDDIVTSWLEPLAALRRAEGLNAHD